MVLGEREETIGDYYTYQEQRDLERYKRFINSSAYDDVRKAEEDISKPLTLEKLRKRSAEHDN